MSWITFHTECMAITQEEHVSREKYADVVSKAYHNCVLRHFESLTAGGTVINTAPKLPMLYNGLLAVGNQNINQHSGVDWIQQVGVHIMQYWAGALITGPTGFVNVTTMGTWATVPIVQNYDFKIILHALATACRIHMLTLIGIYTSTVIVPPVVAPWSGALLITTP